MSYFIARSVTILMCAVDSATDGATGSGIGGRDRHSHELIALRLKITVKDLFARLDQWCIALLEHTNESERSWRVPNSHTRWISIEAHDATWKMCDLDFKFIFWTLTHNLAKVIYVITTSQRKKWPLRLSH